MNRIAMNRIVTKRIAAFALPAALVTAVCLPASAYSAAKTVSGFASGLSTVGYTLYNPSTGAVAVARTTAGVHETTAGSGIYTALVTPPDGNPYSVVWDSGETTPAFASDPINPSGGSVTVGGYAAGQDPATLLKADASFAKLLSHILDKYTYAPGTHALTVKGDDGTTTLGTVTITVDTKGNIVSRL